jgi:hypothetical protein
MFQRIKSITKIAIILLTAILSSETISYSVENDMDLYIRTSKDGRDFIIDDGTNQKIFIPIGANYFDPVSFKTNGIENIFTDYDGPINIATGFFNENYSQYQNPKDNPSYREWIIVSKAAENDEVRIYDTDSYTDYYDFKYYRDLIDIFDDDFDGGYSAGVYVAAGNLFDNLFDHDDLVVSTMEPPGRLKIFRYVPTSDEKFSLAFESDFNPFDDDIPFNVFCYNLDGEGTDELILCANTGQDVPVNQVPIKIFSIENGEFIEKYKVTMPFENTTSYTITAGNFRDSYPLEIVVGYKDIVAGVYQILVLEENNDEYVVESTPFKVMHELEVPEQVFLTAGKYYWIYSDNRLAISAYYPFNENFQQLITLNYVGYFSDKMFHFNISDASNEIEGPFLPDSGDAAYSVCFARLKSAEDFQGKYSDQLIIYPSNGKDTILIRGDNYEKNNFFSSNAPKPRIYNFNKFDLKRIDRHFEKLENIGINIIRYKLTPSDFTPENKANQNLKNLDSLLASAKKHGLRVILVLLSDTEDYPQEWGDIQPYNKTFVDSFIDYINLITAHYADDHPEIFSYEISSDFFYQWNVPNGGTDFSIDFLQWIHNEYGEKSNWLSMWFDVNSLFDNWDFSINLPSDLSFNNFGETMRKYDFQRFRELKSTEFFQKIVNAIRDIDKNHIIGSPMLSIYSLPSLYQGYDYTSQNPYKLGKLFDYLSISAYPYPIGYSSSQTEYGNLPDLIIYMSYFLQDKPIMISEFGDSGIVEKIGSFIDKTNKICSGWILQYAFSTLDQQWFHHDCTLFGLNEESTLLGNWYKDNHDQFIIKNHPNSPATFIMNMRRVFGSRWDNSFSNFIQSTDIENGVTVVCDYVPIIKNSTLEPEIGSTAQKFSFECEYKDESGNPPLSCDLYITKNNSFSTFIYPMKIHEIIQDDYSFHAIYRVEINLPEEGSYLHYFKVVDDYLQSYSFPYNDAESLFGPSVKPQIVNLQRINAVKQNIIIGANQ